MISTIHHLPLGWDFTMTNPHRKDWLRGENHLLGCYSRETHLGGEDCPSSWGLIAGTINGAKTPSGEIDVAKIALGCGVSPLE